MSKLRCLNGNMLKIIAAITMFIDHMGIILFPKVIVFRYIGRLAFPIFAWMISEGAKYTKNKLKYFLNVFILGVVCQVFYFIVNNNDLKMQILITFSLSILLIYLLQYYKKNIIFNKNLNKILRIALPIILISIEIILVYVLTMAVKFDYGFWGVMTPVLASLFDFKNINTGEKLKKLDNHYIRLLFLSIGLILTSIYLAKYQFLSLFSIILLLMYSEKRGKFNLKYFFYLFYPAHLALLYGLSIIL